ncbi:MAG: protein-tyrosine phosphatase family protein [Candidatus Methanodesulfokora washburnensis]|jgi:atypical dual specificity phosphatase
MRPPRNFSWVNNWLAASAIPDDIRQILWLKERGFEFIISLEELDKEIESFIEEVGIKRFYFPVEDFSAPSVDDLMRITDLLLKLEGRKVLIHCYAGCGRTGTVLAAYMIRKGMSAEEAISYVRSMRPCSIETEEQELSLIYFEMASRAKMPYY